MYHETKILLLFPKPQESMCISYFHQQAGCDCIFATGTQALPVIHQSPQETEPGRHVALQKPRPFLQRRRLCQRGYRARLSERQAGRGDGTTWAVPALR